MRLIPLILLASPAFAQEPAATVPTTAAPNGQVPAATQSANAEALRAQIHEMRMNLLVGGDRVRQAEREAVDFYRQKSAVIDERLDSNRTDLTEKIASYDVALKRSLESRDKASRQKAMNEAAALRGEITALKLEAGDLERKRGGLAELIQMVETRDRERERLVAELETAEDYSAGLGFPLASIGLAPALESTASGSPLDNPELVEDLLARDPAAARRLLFESDPQGYWLRFPLRPPAASVREAFRFPLPDLPGER